MMVASRTRRTPDVNESDGWYERWSASLVATPEGRASYEEVAAERGLWLQLVEARMDAGLTQAQLAKRLGVSQAQVARAEQRGYDSYTMKTLRRYVAALGGGYVLEVAVRPREEAVAKKRVPRKLSRPRRAVAARSKADSLRTKKRGNQPL